MTPWLILPSADPVKAKENLPKWRERGWLIAVLVDNKQYLDAHHDAYDGCAIIVVPGEYHGYPWAIKEILKQLPKFDTVCAAGDDMQPEPNFTANQMAERYWNRFPDGIGVYQPCGDMWMQDASGKPAAARICGSPIVSCEFTNRINGGKGLFWPEYAHWFSDEELCCVATKMGCLWHDYDTSHKHLHWHRTKQPRPPHMVKHEQKWKADEDLFKRRKAEGFPGSEML